MKTKIIAFALGATVGTLSTWLFLRKKYELLVQEEIASVRETRGLRAKQEPIDEVCEKKLVPSDRRYKKVIRQYGGDPIVEGDSNDPSEIEDLSAEEAIYCKYGAEPYVIPIEEFTEGETNFDKVTLYYYAEDNTLADENEEIIDEVEKVVGENLGAFGYQSEDPEVVYIRNHQLEVDYEVIRVNKSYAETVAGFPKET